MTHNWMELRHASPFVVEMDAIEASLIAEAAQSHAIVLARKREAVEASKEPGKHHKLALIAADERALLEVSRRVEQGMARELSVMRSQDDMRELFKVVTPSERRSA